MATIPPPRTASGHRIPAIPGILLACLLGGASRADVVELEDGRRFEGKVLSEDGGKVRIDARIGSVRATVGFDRSEVKKVERKDLPPGFFDPPPAADRVSDPGKFRPGQPLYLEVPIIGAIGKDVTAEGVRSVLSYARTHRIPHIVFSIDSEGGDIDEASEIYKLLQTNEKHFRYHCLVRKCRGDALAVPVWSDTLQILPGGVLGGGLENLSAPGKKAKGAEADDAEEREILFTRLALKVVTETGRSGRQAEIVRALLDPNVEFAAWRDKDGTGHTGSGPPEGAEVLVSSGGGKSLVITHDQAIRFGMPKFEGEAKDLGAQLKLEGWAAESDYGVKTMARAAAERRKKADQLQASYEARAARNISRREETDRHIESALKEAAAWDPTKGSYETYSQHWNWGWGWSGGSAVEWTEESQKKWRTRTDATLHYLQQAAKGLRVMKKLDAEAVKLQLDPTFQPGEIDTMIEDIKVRFAALQEHRSKKGE